MASSAGLQRFLDAQAGVFGQALAELRAGRKQSHWMWFVFPQLQGLGRSPTARFYGLASLEEARAYLAHPVLGRRLAEAARTVLAAPEGASLHAVFGSPDDLKFVSSMTLFRLAEGEPPRGPFQAALDRFNSGRLDPRTVELVSPSPPAG